MGLKKDNHDDHDDRNNEEMMMMRRIIYIKRSMSVWHKDLECYDAQLMEKVFIK